MRKMLCEIDLEKAQGYPGRYLESRPDGTVSRLRNLGHAIRSKIETFDTADPRGRPKFGDIDSNSTTDYFAPELQREDVVGSESDKNSSVRYQSRCTAPRLQPMKNNRFLSNVGGAFGAKATRYQAHAHVQQRALARLVRHPSFKDLSGKMIADIGAGIGVLGPILKKADIHGRLLGIDISFEALHIGKLRNEFGAGAVQADMTTLPLVTDSVDGVVLSSSAQWLSDPCASAQPVAQILKPGGIFAFGVLLEGTLVALRKVQKRYRITPPVHYCRGKEYIEAVEACGLTIIHSEERIETDHYETGMAFLRGLSAIGSTAHDGMHLSRQVLAGFARDSEAMGGTDTGVIAQYNYLLGVARK